MKMYRKKVTLGAIFAAQDPEQVFEHGPDLWLTSRKVRDRPEINET
jgi:hypothetical protein